ncbi:MAG: SDR family oxidoreductase [Bacteroidales bacterium]|nr:SDR family oxidoreductase [Bacteroidales bacterium]MBN2818680.1 SDR family oxidoreductase [Bacteroidales bacterium]
MTKPSFDDLKDQVCVLTGGAGVIGSSIALGLASVGVKTAILDINEEMAVKVAADIESKTGTITKGYKANVLDKQSLEDVKVKINRELGTITLLINGAGGNSPKATTQIETIDKDNISELEKSFYGLEVEGFQWVFDLNFKGTLLPSMVFTKDMLTAGGGAVLNISSMNAYKPLTKIPAYSAAKASINNFTEWLSVHLAKVGIRVNAVAPGFFLTNQNRFLLVDEKTGNPTPRGQKIISNTPMGRYGEVEELQGTVLYLLSGVSKFVTGICIPVDGGYSAFGGV